MKLFNRYRAVLLSFLFLLSLFQMFGQVYTEKQTRHRFAQMTMGMDYQSSIEGTTMYLDEGGSRHSLDLAQVYKARLLIGGIHFWGHADFYIAIPLFNPVFTAESQKIRYSSSVETVFKYYPVRIEQHKVRPFIGVSLAPFHFQQTNGLLGDGQGPDLVHTSLPLVTGITYNSKQHLFEANVMWNYANAQDYYISRMDLAEVKTPPVYLSLSYKYMFETTLSAEEEWESGRTAQITELLEGKGKLNGFFLGVGMSSSFWQGPSTYNDAARPYIMDYPISVMPDFAAGYYFHKPDLNIAASYRSYGTSTEAYGTTQALKRKSTGVEVTRFLFDYHGFAPFLGPVITYEHLSFSETNDGLETIDVADQQLGYGLTLGWDIRPNRIQTWLLRTNLRWFPYLKLKVDGEDSISFDNVEFNFIQFIVFPGRMF